MRTVYPASKRLVPLLDSVECLIKALTGTPVREAHMPLPLSAESTPRNADDFRLLQHPDGEIAGIESGLFVAREDVEGALRFRVREKVGEGVEPLAREFALRLQIGVHALGVRIRLFCERDECRVLRDRRRTEYEGIMYLLYLCKYIFRRVEIPEPPSGHGELFRERVADQKPVAYRGVREERRKWPLIVYQKFVCLIGENKKSVFLRKLRNRLD